ncbi:hypothetical protein D3C87_1231210 [compost metagenome]
MLRKKCKKTCVRERVDLLRSRIAMTASSTRLFISTSTRHPKFLREVDARRFDDAARCVASPRVTPRRLRSHAAEACRARRHRARPRTARFTGKPHARWLSRRSHRPCVVSRHGMPAAYAHAVMTSRGNAPALARHASRASMRLGPMPSRRTCADIGVRRSDSCASTTKE